MCAAWASAGAVHARSFGTEVPQDDAGMGVGTAEVAETFC